MADGIYETLYNNWLVEMTGKPIFEKKDLGSGEHPKLTIAISGTFAPFSYISNGQPTGSVNV